MAELEKKIAIDKSIEVERQKIEIICTEVEAYEAKDYKKKPLGVIEFIGAAITIKNKSSLSVKRVGGFAVFSDETGREYTRRPLQEELKPADMDIMGYYNSNLNLEPGAEWKGKIYMRFDNPQKSNHAFPVPAGKKYQAALTDLEVTFVDVSQRDIESRARRYKGIQESINNSETKLAKLK